MRLRQGVLHWRLLALVGVLVCGVVGFSSCGAVDEPQEHCDLPPQAHDETHTHVSAGVGRLSQAMACGAGTADYPASRNFTKGVDALTSYVGQTQCSPSAKPGVAEFRAFILKTYPCTGDYGISRSCSVGGKSEHKEGRAWDWKLNYPHPAATNLLKWLLATDSKGNKYAMARRIGIMYMIWNRKIWKAYQASKGWQAYTGASPHTDHVHFSFSWDCANKKTSWWSGTELQNGCTNQQASTCQLRGCGCKNGECTGGKAEVCDGKDNNCDGRVDEGKPGSGKACDTKKAAPCDQGLTECQSGKIVCIGNVAPLPEACNGKDDDCNGQIDDGNPGGGQACDPGGGVSGIAKCIQGKLVCAPVGSQEPSGPEPAGPEPTQPDAAGPEPSGPEPTQPDTAPPVDQSAPVDLGPPAQSKLKLGERDCTNGNDCESGLCAKVGEVSRCTQKCTQNAECPEGFECKLKQACWPQGAIDLSKGDVCHEADPSCLPPGDLRPRGSGCSCQSTNSRHVGWLWLLLLLLPGLLLRTHRRLSS